MNKQLVAVIIAVFFLASVVLADLLLGIGLGQKTAGFIAPVGVVFSTTGQRIGGFFNGIMHIGSLQNENKDLNERLNAAISEIAALSSAKAENDSLRRDLGFKSNSQLNLLPASVAYFDPSLKDGITVVADDASAIKVGNAVLAEGFLIGRVAMINGNNIRVLLITDNTSSIPSTILDKGITGIAAGKIGNGLTMDQVPQSDNATSGDLVVTSGLGGDLPKGLVLGRVDNVQKIAGSIFQQVMLQPMLEFVTLERVMIVL